ncbi:MAG: carbohydrate ABC transporter permease [Clostridiales bacterium]|nr:carbohydrate ABC transporter permease [Clostridiales bacterium]
MNAKSKKRCRKIALYVVLVIMALVTLFPLLWAISSSLRSDTEIYTYAMPFSIHTLIPVEFTVKSYVQLFTEFNFLHSLKNTLIVVFVLIPCGCIINSIAAVPFAFFDFKFKNAIFAVFMVSFMIPFESIAIPLYNLVNDLGWVDTKTALIVPALANGLVLFLFRQFFSDIPTSLIEAARVDGASWPRIYFSIIMPSSVPIFITAGLMLLVNQWNAYMWPLLVARTESSRTIMITLATLKMEHQTLWSCLYAGSIISALIPIALFLPLQRYFVEGVTSSGVKG